MGWTDWFKIYKHAIKSFWVEMSCSTWKNELLFHILVQTYWLFVKQLYGKSINYHITKNIIIHSLEKCHIISMLTAGWSRYSTFTRNQIYIAEWKRKSSYFTQAHIHISCKISDFLLCICSCSDTAIFYL